MNNEEMRKMWEAAGISEEQLRMRAHRNGWTPDYSPRQEKEKRTKNWEARKTYHEGKKIAGIMADKIQNGPKAAARKLETKKDKTEETP